MEPQNLFLWTWVAIMLIPEVVSSEGIPHALRSLVVIPAVMIFAALGFELIISKTSNWLNKKMEQHPENLQQLLRIKKELVALLFIFLLAIAVEAYNQYFMRWAPNPNIAAAFNENYAELGRYLNTLPASVPKYVIVNTGGVGVRGIPMPAQTVMFITKTFLPEWQAQKNIFYVLPENLDSFAQEANQNEHLYITMLEIDHFLRQTLKQKIPGLISDVTYGSVVLYR